jgi:hypothetical protein
MEPQPAQRTIRKPGTPLDLLTRNAVGSYDPVTEVVTCHNQYGSFQRSAKGMDMKQVIQWMETAKPKNK